MKDEDDSTSKKSKLKKSGSLLIRKFKSKQQQQSRKSSSTPSVSSAESDLTAASSSVRESEEIRQSPDGLDNVLVRTASDSNLTDNWKSAENLAAVDECEQSQSQKQVNIEIVQIEKIKRDALTERTRSLEDLQAMPAFGDLIVDARPSNHTNVSNKPTKDHLYKILVIGDLGSGKTSIIKRYVHDFFSQHYRATIGVDFALKVLHWDENTVIRLQLWDIAGQERYGNMTRVYYKEAVGAFIVFDVTRSNTFESVSNWKADLDSKVQLPDGSSIPCVLLGNKCDQPKEGIVNSPNKMNDFCEEKGFTGWFETSAKENINIEAATNALINEILTNDIINAHNNGKDKDQFTLTQRKEDAEKQKCYKC